jgi:hypothetical protein
MHWRRVWTWLVGLALLVSSATARAQCTKDIECKGDRVCNRGVCDEAANVGRPPGEPAPGPGSTSLSSASGSEPVEVPMMFGRRSRGAMVTGIVLTSAGAASFIATTVFVILSVNCRSDFDDKFGNNTLPEAAADELERCRSYQTSSGVAALGGLVLTGVGIPLWIYGAKKVPVRSAVLSPWLAPNVAGLSLSVRH